MAPQHTYMPHLSAGARGLNANALLDSVVFPVDEYDRIVRRERKHRLSALRGKKLAIPGDSTYERLRNNHIFAKQLQKIAAAVSIQATWRAHYTRYKYTAVRFGSASVKAHDADSKIASISGLDEMGEPLPLPSKHSLAVSKDKLQQNDNGPGLDNIYLSMVETKGQMRNRQRIAWTFPDLKNLDVELAKQDKLHSKYRQYQQLFESVGQEPPHYDEFCVFKIQSTWRMWRSRCALQMTLNSLSDPHSRRKTIVNYLEREHIRQDVDMLQKSRDGAATIIQKKWKQTWNRMIYQYMRDLVRLRESADPRRILKLINPKESHLVDAAAGLHVRFRLGGDIFPPSIYYKIYAHRSTIDLGAMAPRNYANPIPASKVNWYQRFENNGWRPIIESINPYDVLEDAIFVKTTYRKVHYPALPTERREEKARKRKERQVQWMKKMYGFQKPQHEAGASSDDMGGDDVMAWTNALDYDAYMEGWTGLGTTQARNDQAMAMMAARASYAAHMTAIAAAAVENEFPTKDCAGGEHEDSSMVIEYDDNSASQQVATIDMAPIDSRATSAKSRVSVDLDSLFSSGAPY